jgi:cobalt-zinc-cadmium efflux system protein
LSVPGAELLSRRTIGLAFILSTSFMILEAAAGFYSGSLALLGDAAHMLVDSAALAMNWLALGWSWRPADSVHTYGHYRLQVIMAFVNGLALLGLAAWITAEAISRFWLPTPVLGGYMLAAALLGLAVNLAALKMLGRNQANLNHRAAWLNVLGDALGSVGAIVSAVLILGWQFYLADPVVSILISLLIVKTSWAMIRQSWEVLMEGHEGIDGRAIYARIMALPAVEEVHDMHIWSLTPERPLITMHVRVNKDSDAPVTLRRVQQMLLEEFGLSHATIQMESEDIYHEPEHELPLKRGARAP